MHRVGTLPPGALGEDPSEAEVEWNRPGYFPGDDPGADWRDGIPEPIDEPEPTEPAPRRARAVPDLGLLEMLSDAEWTLTTPALLEQEGLDGYGGLVTAHDVPWGELAVAYPGTAERTVVVRYVEETPDDEHRLDPMLTYDVYTWPDGRRRLRSLVISMTDMEA